MKTCLAIFCAFWAFMLSVSAEEKVHIPAGISHAAWDGLLQKYVNEQGLVAYGKWKANTADLEALDDYLKLYAGVDGPRATGRDLAASGVNAYNAFAIRWILQNYPTESIRSLDHSFDGKRHLIGGQIVSLDDIEHGTLRGAVGYQAHAVLVCCARSCPPLQRFAFTPDQWEAQVATAYSTWLGRVDLNRFSPDNGSAEISSIFKWFAEDFEKAGGAKVILAKYGPVADREFLKNGEYSISYLPYNWGLNDQGRQGEKYNRLKALWDYFF